MIIQLWKAIQLKRQQAYVEELRDNILVTKRGLAHLQYVHSRENRELARMQIQATGDKVHP